MTLTVQKITGSPEAVLAELARAITEAGNHKAKPLDEELLGLERKPHERVRTIDPKAAANGKPVARKVENILLTIRDDLLEARKHLLHGATRRDTLRDLDYTVDQIDNLLAEM
jgi:hypothetical protein